MFENFCVIPYFWAMTGEAKGDQINEQRGMGVQEVKTQEWGGSSRGKGVMSQSRLLGVKTQGEGRRRGGIWTAAARECQMFKGDINKMVL